MPNCIYVPHPHVSIIFRSTKQSAQRKIEFPIIKTESVQAKIDWVKKRFLSFNNFIEIQKCFENSWTLFLKLNERNQLQFSY